MRTMRIACLLLACFLAGCDDFDIGGIMDRYREDFHCNYPLSAGGTLEIDTAPGSGTTLRWTVPLG